MKKVILLLCIVILFLLVVLAVVCKYQNIFEGMNETVNVIQTWKDDNIPEKVKPLVEKIKQMKNINYMFFNDNDIDEFIRKEYPEYSSTFFSFPKTIQKIDFFRYLVVFHYGGVYLDIDMNIKKNFDTLDKSKCVFPVEFLEIDNGMLKDQGCDFLIGQYAFYSPKKHPFLKLILENIKNKRVDLSKYHEDSHEYVYYSTGPVMVTQSYIDFSEKDTLELISPQPFQNECFGDFGRHEAMGNWK